MGEPISLGVIFTSVSSAFKFAEFAIRVAEVGSENEVFVRTISIVRDDLSEVERLLNDESVRQKCTSIPGKLPWIRGAIHNTNSALNEIGKWVERARVEQESTGSVRLETRVRWVLSDHEKLLNRKTELMTCHQQLSNVLGYLIRLEDVPTTSQPPEYLDSTFFDEVLSRHKRNAILPPRPPDQRLEKSQGYQVSTANMTSSSNAWCEPSVAPICEDIAHNEYSHHVTTSGTWHQVPLCSPPPLYSPVITSSVSSNQAYFNTGARCTGYNNTDIYEYKEQDSRWGASVTKAGNDIQQTNVTWAHEYSEQDLSLSELAGDTLCMSGTNPVGPVDPFEFIVEPLPQSNPEGRKRNALYAPPREIADPALAVELPNNDPGPFPGYPSRSNNLLLPVKTGAWLTKTKISGRPPAFAYDGQRRSPMAAHAYDALSLLPHNSSSLRAQSIPVQPITQTDCADPRLTSNPVLPLPVAFAHQSLPDNATLDVAPTSMAQLLPQSASSIVVRHATDTQSVCYSHAEAMHTKRQDAQQLSPPASVATRMHRQKDMMDLLGHLRL